jgi:hypothetical protein
MVGEGRTQGVGIADQRAPGFERRVEPLVRIHGHRIGAGERAQILRRIGDRGREPAVRAVHVEPHAVLAADRRDLRAADRSLPC